MRDQGVEELDLAYDILIYAKHLPVAIEFVRRFERQRFVLDHLAKPNIKEGSSAGFGEWARGLKELASFPNVLCKISGLVTEADWQNWKAADFSRYLEVAFDCFGAERLMVGSDWPVCTLAADYARVMDVMKDYLSKYPSAAQDAVLGNNARRFWRLA